MISERSEIQARLRSERDRLFHDRLRVAAWLALVSTPAYFAAEYFWLPVNGLARLVLVTVHFAGLAAVIALLGRPWVKDHLVATALLFASELSLATAAAGVLRGDFMVTGINLNVLVMGTALLLPWGTAAQAAQVAVATLCMAVNLMAIDTSGSLAVLGVVAVGFSVSVFMAHVIEKSRRALESENTERLLAEAEVRRARDELEARVVERTETLASTNRRLEEEIDERIRAERDLERAREAAESGSRAKSEFLATMSHELRTPINIMLGMSELIDDGKLAADQRECLRALQSAGESLLGLVNNLLDVARLDARGTALAPTDFDPRALASSVVSGYAPQAEARGLSLRLEVDGQVPARVRGAADRIRQVLDNFLSNAIKFTHHGEVTVRIGLEHQRERGPVLRFEVSDTGIGMGEEVRHNLFRPFWQADMSNTRAYPGTGIGLAICRRLAEMTNGEVGARSTPGAGSTFWFVVPLAPASSSVAAAEVAAAAPPAVVVGRSCVLLVEDDAQTQSLLVRMLGKLGFDVEVAANGKEAIEFIRRRTFAAVLMDCQMPVLDGFEATRHIRLLEEDVGRRTPIIAVTAGVLEGDRERCLEVGMDDYVSKPVRMSDLGALLQRWVITDDVPRQ